MIQESDFATKDQLALQTGYCCKSVPLRDGYLRLPSPLHAARQIAEDHPKAGEIERGGSDCGPILGRNGVDTCFGLAHHLSGVRLDVSAVAIGSRAPAARIGAGTLLVVGAENNHSTTTMLTFRGDACANRKKRGVPASVVLPIRLLGNKVKGLIERQTIDDCSAVWVNVFLYHHAMLSLV